LLTRTFTPERNPDVFTLSSLAKWLESDEPTVLQLLKEARIPKPRCIASRLVRWTIADLERWADAGCPASEPMDPDDLQFVRDLLELESLSRRHPAGKR
jgi:predicted DNA-binding transcriptional regulator AlpA